MGYTRVKVSFIIESDRLEPDIISKEIGLIPTEFWRKGDIIKESRKRKTGSWELSVGYEESLDISVQIDKLYNQIKGKTNSILNSKKAVDGIIVLSIVIEIENGQTPGIVIEEKISAFMAKIGGDIDIDIYLMS